MDQDSAFMSSLVYYPFKKFVVKINTVASYNHQSSQAEHGIKSLSTVLTKHLTDLGQVWLKYLPLATLAYNTFNTPSLAYYSPYELVFSQKLKLLLDLETNPDINVSGTFKDYYTLLTKWLQYLHKSIQDFKLKRLAMINKDSSYSSTTVEILYTLSHHLLVS